VSGSLHIGIVGGSIAGCAAAIALSRAGHRISVFERSSRELVGRGAGIGTPTTLFDKLVAKGYLDADLPRFEAAGYPMASRSRAAPRYGHIALTLPLEMTLVNWGDLYRNLRKRVPDALYRIGVGVTEVGFLDDSRVELVSSDGLRTNFDLVLFADGYRSLGRSVLFPNVEAQYRGYVLWRGVLEERYLSDADPLETSLYRLHYKGLPGNAVFYFVPGANGSVAKGARWVNWACYVPVPSEELPGFLVDRYGNRHTTSLPPGLMRVEEEERLKDLMEAHLPSYFGEIVDASSDTFAQPIYTVEVPAYARNRCCLIGDAGFVAPPFTGSGVFKAANNAIELGETLTGDDDLDAALSIWSQAQVSSAEKISVLGKQMEEAFVWSAPDFEGMDEEAARAWWTSAVTFPEDFRYIQGPKS